EAFYALCHPETDNLLKLFSYILIIPVQVRLGHMEKMQVILIKLLHILPGVSPKLALPVGGRLTILLSLAEEEEIFVIGISFHSLSEPLVAAGYVVEYHVKHQADSPLTCLRNQLLQILHSAVPGINIVIVLYIIAVVILGRYEKR